MIRVCLTVTALLAGLAVTPAGGEAAPVDGGGRLVRHTGIQCRTGREGHLSSRFQG
jgi:hypothetical protein